MYVLYDRDKTPITFLRGAGMWGRVREIWSSKRLVTGEVGLRGFLLLMKKKQRNVLTSVVISNEGRIGGYHLLWPEGGGIKKWWWWLMITNVHANA